MHMSETIDRPPVRSERINLLVSAAEKRELEDRARSAGLSVSEFLRRAGERYDPDIDWQELDTLAQEFERATDRLDGKLADVLSSVEASFTRMNDEAGMRARAEAQLADLGWRWPGDGAA